MGAFAAGWSVAALALVSPLCPLSVALFSARVGQHMALTLIAAPLVALGDPLSVRRSDGRRTRPRAASAEFGAPAAATAFALALWFWHAPGPYAATFHSDLVYWSMHVALFGAALWLWSELLNRPPSVAIAGASLFSMMQMSFLGALLTLAPGPLFEPHLLTTAAWGLTPLQDQQLGGAIMWAPGGVIFLAETVFLTLSLLAKRPEDRRSHGWAEAA
jgi:putative membrane protein